MTILCGADVETTGFKQEKGHRIIEFGAQLWHLESRKLLKDINIRINPLRDIPEDASKVHGIYLEDLHDAPTWDKVAPVVNAVLSKADIFIAHNVGFDAPFIGGELIRVGQVPKDMELFCTMENGRFATATGKSPKLEELCWALNVDFDRSQAHSATYDVQKMMEALWKGIDQGYYKLPLAA